MALPRLLLTLVASIVTVRGDFDLSNPSWNTNRDTFTATLSPSDSSSNPYSPDLTSLSFTLSVASETTSRVKITSPTDSRWEIPESIVSAGDPTPSLSIDDASFTFDYTESPFTFTVKDVDGSIVFDSSAALHFGDQYLELSTSLESDNKLFGLGEKSRSTGSVIPKGSTTTMWARDMAAAEFDTNLYASHPFFVSLSSSGKANGAFLRNSNGMDVVYSEAGDALTFKALGGVIDLFTFTGPKPSDVVKQYQSIIGTPTLQPYWALGFHQCRYGYTNLQEAIDVVQGYADAEIPLDIAWLDIDYMNLWLDFTYDEANFPSADVKAFVDQLHANNQKFVPIVDPGILAVDPSWDWAQDYDAYYSGIAMDVFVKDITNEKPFMGQVWPGPVHFPDWFHPNATEFWTAQLKNWHDIAEFDGVWVDMNEVSNFCTGQICENTDPDNCPTHKVDTQTQCCLSCSDVDPDNSLDNPSFLIGNDLGINEDKNPSPIDTKTIPASAKHYGDLNEYDVHNLHGTMEAKVTSDAMHSIRGTRSFVLSRSSFPGHGNHASHWTGDNAATWDDLKMSIVTVNDFALFGISMVGADICGFIGDSNEELCARWIQVGAFHPFSRNHNTFGAAPQEFYIWDSVAESARRALGLRYQILPFMYTLMWKAHVDGDVVSNYLWSVFPEDEATHGVDEQFMLGDSILISPVLQDQARDVDAYFPTGKWYNLFTLENFESAGEVVNLATELEEANAHLRGGKVLPMASTGGLTTVDVQNDDFSLVVALPSESDAEGLSEGELFVDDGESIEVTSFLHMVYSATSTCLTSKAVENSFDASNAVSTVKVLGVTAKVQSATIQVEGGEKRSVDLVQEDEVLTLDLADVGVGVKDEFVLTWM
jgi:alpha-glucosidase (family GH31 glycosyl hydrolase)